MAPVTTGVRGIPAEVPLGPTDLLPKACAVKLDSIVTVAKSVLRERIAVLGADRIHAVDQAIHALGLRS